ncbi:hypothetical protein [Photobacterium halotolerans]|uniref:hypothetical protein n=1 Tax=Photobacterium halotolerans TaxID=265726 RepID=UPI0013723790|nr:hypothetical protein [Photobacterium halotolerans]NAW86917.1 hypothetical protein [Photobacterium halotolerans]
MMSFPPSNWSMPNAIGPIILATVLTEFGDRIKHFFDQKIPELAKKKEDEDNTRLARIKVGEKFFGLEVVKVEVDTVFLQFKKTDTDAGILLAPGRLFVDKKNIPGLKFDFVSAIFEIEKTVNYTKLDKPIVRIREIQAFTVDMKISYKNQFSLNLGGGEDKLRVFSQYKVAFIWSEPKFSFYGFLADSKEGGFVIVLKVEGDFVIPLVPPFAGLCGAGITYAERFAPKLTEEVDVDPFEVMQKSSIMDYVAWAKKNDLEKWVPVSRDIRIFGVSSILCDIPSTGNIVKLGDQGLIFISEGPVIMLGGKLIILRNIETIELLGALDVQSETLFLSGRSNVDIIPWAPGALQMSGNIDFHANFSNDRQTWLALGGYQMNGCRVSLLNLLKLDGGARLTTHHFAARAAARLHGELDTFVAGVGFSLGAQVSGLIGWNPSVLQAGLHINGAVWIHILGSRFGVGVDLATILQTRKPELLYIRLVIQVNLPWPLPDFSVPIKLIDDIRDDQIHPPSENLPVTPEGELTYLYSTDGETGKLGAAGFKVRPDVSLQFSMAQTASTANLSANDIRVVNSTARDGRFWGGGVHTRHDLYRFKLYKLDEMNNEQLVPDITACWLGLASTGQNPLKGSRLLVPAINPFEWLNKFPNTTPGKIEFEELLNLQMFGNGPDKIIEVDQASQFAELKFDRLRLRSKTTLELNNHPIEDLQTRVLRAFSIFVSIPNLATDYFEARFVLPDPDLPPDSIFRVNGGAAIFKEIRSFKDETKEWKCIITPSQPEVEIWTNNENGILLEITAIGYRFDVSHSKPPLDTILLESGRYKLAVSGQSVAQSHKISSDVVYWDDEHYFEVVNPPLRPYAEHSSVGDEREFGFAGDGWIANPKGTGFLHYRDYSATYRANVDYLQRIYPLVYVEASLDEPKQECRVGPNVDGDFVPTEIAERWRQSNGVAKRVADEFQFLPTNIPGNHECRVYISKTADGQNLELVEKWKYQVSQFETFSKHVTPQKFSFNRVFSSNGMVPLDVNTTQPKVPLDPSSALPANLSFDWVLPRVFQDICSGQEEFDGRAYMHILDWMGYFKSIHRRLGQNLVNPVESTLYSLMSGRDDRPFGILLRTPEPVDWRRVSIALVYIGTDSKLHSLTTRLIPSPDGTSAIMLPFVEGLVSYLPKGKIHFYYKYNLKQGRMPRIRLNKDDITESEFSTFAIYQPIGRERW